MKFGIALTGLTLTLFGATAAQAQLTITLSPASPVTDPAQRGLHGVLTARSANTSGQHRHG